MKTRQELIDNGFVPATYEDQEGEFLVKRMRVEQMPYASEHMIDNDMIFGSSEAIVEVTPDNRVQFLIFDADYVEGPVSLDTEEGQSLLEDALNVRV